MNGFDKNVKSCNCMCMDIQSAINFLEENGYSVVSIKATVVTFPCSYGHNHKTQTARDSCLLKARTGMTREEYVKSKRDASVPRYLAAYDLFARGMKKAQVARTFSVSNTRAGQMIKKGWRIAIKNGAATVKP